jgi:cAMP-dependent protein kinase regulator
MLHFLEKQIGKATKKLSVDESMILDELRIQYEYFVKKVDRLEERKRKHEKEEEDNEDEEGEEEEDEHEHEEHETVSSDEDEDEDEIEDLPDVIKAPPKFRKSVSAEAYGLYNKKGYFNARTIDKEEKTKEDIKERLLKSFMFASLDERDLEIVINAMEIKIFNRDDNVIEQNDDGDELFVVGEGKLQCYRTEKHETNLIRSYSPGDYFGELALLYNAPRAATIKAIKNNVVLYSLDRLTFNHIVKDSTIKRRDKYEEMLRKVKVLDSLDSVERGKLIDAVSEHSFKEGEKIIKQGDPGYRFYFIMEGKASATKIVKQGDDPIHVMDYAQGDYFGEVALIKNQPRAASIIAETNVTTL